MHYFSKPNRCDRRSGRAIVGAHRASIHAQCRGNEAKAVARLLRKSRLTHAQDMHITERATDLIERYRRQPDSGFWSQAMAGMGLDSETGVSLLKMAEAFLRTPDRPNAIDITAEQLSRIAPEGLDGRTVSLRAADRALGWSQRLAHKACSDPSGWARRTLGFGHPIATQLMNAMSSQFVCGESIESAYKAAQGNTVQPHSFDMLGEGARTVADAHLLFDRYLGAIRFLDATARGHATYSYSVSVKLSALSPKFEQRYRNVAFDDLFDKLSQLVDEAMNRGVAVTIDAEEARRLEFSLDLIEALVRRFAGSPGLGFAVQAYQQRALAVIAWAQALAEETQTRLHIRLVKGAYWDAEIKEAQILGLDGFPVFTQKSHTDLSYLVCAQTLIDTRECLVPQFATHNAYTMHAVASLAGGIDESFEWQRLHGMGEGLYAHFEKQLGVDVPHRVYAPVGEYQHLLPYLVRRLLENGANSSFLNGLSKTDVAANALAQGPFTMINQSAINANSITSITAPADLFGPSRLNARGSDLSDPALLSSLEGMMVNERCEPRCACPIINGLALEGEAEPVYRPADRDHVIGSWVGSTVEQVGLAVRSAAQAQITRSKTNIIKRSMTLRSMADRLEQNRNSFIALLVDEAGKTFDDAVSEIREAVDFCRYYANEADRLLTHPQQFDGPTGESNTLTLNGRGVFVCISPWNFPLAIFVGQIAAALATGNAVVAKPAEQTPLIAFETVKHFHAAGIPAKVLQLVLGDGAIGSTLVRNPHVAGVVFTGSTATAKSIQQALAQQAGPIIPLIAETGGLNAMVVDSTALTEQVVDAAATSAFGSAGQRCSAVRLLLVQSDVYEKTRMMLIGAMQALIIGDPRKAKTDIGPVIDHESLERLLTYLKDCEKQGWAVSRGASSNVDRGTFFSPCLVEIETPADLNEEVFGPVLHLCSYENEALGEALSSLKTMGYGLTLGIQTRRESFKLYVQQALPVGNTYINRDTVGAVVGLQPFGGEGLSGTGPKAGGPNYLTRFCTERVVTENTVAAGGNIDLFNSHRLPKAQ